MDLYAIIVAGGSGSRMGGVVPKQFLLLDGTPILGCTLMRFQQALPSVKLLVALPESHMAMWQQMRTQHPEIPHHKVVAGGASRSTSVFNALAHVPGDCLVAIHDGVRPYVSEALIRNCYEAAANHQAVTAAMPARESLRRLLPGGGSEAVPRNEYYTVQTPQVFLGSLIKQAYQHIPLDGTFTDDASVAEAAGHTIHLVEGEAANVKITFKEDLEGTNQSS